MNNTFLEVLKWIGLVLAAGFIGYFGRYLAVRIIEKTNRNKSDTSTPKHDTDTPLGAEFSNKVEKKKTKAEIKKAKKTDK